jgi:multicomponent Na+:H+ antiporter subunit G
MSEALIIVLLALGVGVEIASSIGVWVASDVFDRLHFLGPASTLGSTTIAAAIVLEERASINSAKTIVTAALMTMVGSVLTHATARAARVRQYGHWQAVSAEEVDQE